MSIENKQIMCAVFNVCNMPDGIAAIAVPPSASGQK